MIRRIITSQLSLTLHQTFKWSLAVTQMNSTEPKVSSQKKAYHALLTNSIELVPKQPTEPLLKLLRARIITRIMARNHNLDAQGVLQAHIVCLAALVNRVQNSIQAITMFVDCFFKEAINLSPDSQIQSKSILCVLKPKILSKIIKISNTIDGLYNQVYRSMVCNVIIRLMQQSNKNIGLKIHQKNRIKRQMDQIRHSKTLKSLKEQQINESIMKQLQLALSELDQNFRQMNELDYWNGFQYVVNLGYYTEQFLVINLQNLLKMKDKEINSCSLELLIYKIKSVVGLQKFKSIKRVGQLINSSDFSQLVNNLMAKYFQTLNNEKTLFQFLNSDEPLIQMSLINQFLTLDHYKRAKKTYLTVFNHIFNIKKNGALLFDIKKLKGIFQIILEIYTYEDTRQIFQFLTQVQRVMVLFPLQKLDKLQAHCYVCLKYGFKSDYLADLFFKNLMLQNIITLNNQGHIHQVHQTTRQIMLAHKFITYLKLGNKISKQNQNIACSIASSLFQNNVWYCLADTEFGSQAFLNNSSFGQSLYYQRTGLNNITASQKYRKAIQSCVSAMNVKNINKHYAYTLQNIPLPNNRFSLKLDHMSNWKYNPHARMVTLIQLANHHYDFLKLSSQQNATDFMQQFLNKTINSTYFYNTLKQKFAYPNLLKTFIELMDRAGLKNYPIQARDLQAMKRIVNTELNKAITQQQSKIEMHYQQYIDAIELNRVPIPSTLQTYGILGMNQYALKSPLLIFIKRFMKEKEYIKLQLDTFFKFIKQGGQAVININYIQYPWYADLKISKAGQDIMVIFWLNASNDKDIINSKQYQILRESQRYWKKKNNQVFLARTQRQIDQIIQKIKKRKFIKK